ncbi:MAG: hypothetical protein JWP63_1124 [Candidatus Solibacter sp.]|jgi:hypothetical protein|nr:hypothetical protein [Candidatus Solibacter sp.]
MYLPLGRAVDRGQAGFLMMNLDLHLPHSSAELARRAEPTRIESDLASGASLQIFWSGPAVSNLLR